MAEHSVITVKEIQANAKPLMDMITNFGCLSFMQARLICGDNTETDRVINYLKRNRIAKKTEDGRHVVDFFTNKIDEDLENCLWVAFRSAAYKDENGKTKIDIETLRYAIHPNNRVNVMYIQNNKCHNVVFLTPENIASVITAIKASNAGQPAEVFEDLDYSFVIDNLDTVASMEKMDFPYNYRILHFQQTEKGVPKISTIKKVA